MRWAAACWQGKISQNTEKHLFDFDLKSVAEWFITTKITYKITQKQT